MTCTTYRKVKDLLQFPVETKAKRKMKKPLLTGVCGLLLLSASMLAQGQLPVKKEMNMGFGSPDIRYEQSWSPEGKAGAGKIILEDSYRVTAWRGERVSMQVLIQADKAITDLEVTSGDLKALAGKGRIKKDAVSVGFLRYVLSNGIGKNGHGCGIDTAVQHIANMVADGIDYTERTKVDINKNQPVWVTVKVPSDAPAGTYKGHLEVAYSVAGTGGTKRHALSYEIKVKNRVLPSPDKWSFHLDLWQYPESIARWYHVKPWSEAHFDKMRPYMQMLADAGQKVITTSIINDPWNGQTYDPYTSMVQWTHKRDGSWSYDYTIFDKWVSYMMGLGIDQQINCYSMVPWHNTFAYYDESSGTNKSLVAKPGTAEYNQFWKGMLEDFARHLKAKGWFNKTTIAMDERPLEAMEKVIDLIKGLPEPFKISLAGSYHRSLDKDIYDYSITTREHYDDDVLARRTKAGLPTTYYTCCTEDHPNTFSFSPPAEGAFIPLLSAERNLSGYLRWAFNAWPEKPWTDSRFGSWSSGDTYFVYPGPGSSIRYEQLVRGVQDFEKIRLLKKELTTNNDTEGLKSIDQALSGCTVENLRKSGAASLVRKVEAVINNL